MANARKRPACPQCKSYLSARMIQRDNALYQKLYDVDITKTYKELISKMEKSNDLKENIITNLEETNELRQKVNAKQQDIIKSQEQIIVLQQRIIIMLVIIAFCSVLKIYKYEYGGDIAKFDDSLHY